MPRTPDQHDLPEVAQEATSSPTRCPTKSISLCLPHHPTVTHDSVLDALPIHPWVHFACPGATDLDDPSTSHLLLTDYLEQPLTMLDLARARLNDPKLAFLSA